MGLASSDGLFDILGIEQCYAEDGTGGRQLLSIVKYKLQIRRIGRVGLAFDSTASIKRNFFQPV